MFYVWNNKFKNSYTLPKSFLFHDSHMRRFRAILPFNNVLAVFHFSIHYCFLLTVFFFPSSSAFSLLSEYPDPIFCATLPQENWPQSHPGNVNYAWLYALKWKEMIYLIISKFIWCNMHLNKTDPHKSWTHNLFAGLFIARSPRKRFKLKRWISSSGDTLLSRVVFWFNRHQKTFHEAMRVISHLHTQ